MTEDLHIYFSLVFSKELIHYQYQMLNFRKSIRLFRTVNYNFINGKKIKAVKDNK